MLQAQGVPSHVAEPYVSLDVVVPSYRADHALLDRILALPVPPRTVTLFVIQLDNPASPAAQATRAALDAAHRDNPWVRVRMNPVNVGASETRNRGLRESAADFVLFLDDDVVPDRAILAAYVASIRANPRATGFIGPTVLPDVATVRQAAVHLAEVSFFWDIATRMPTERHLPWGVTANLCVRRDPDGRLRFNRAFPRTGGGEDIDFCLKARAWHLAADPTADGFVATPNAVASHPYLEGGACPLAHFSGWSYGDGHLIDLYPDLSYRNLPELAEALLLGAIVTSVAAAQHPHPAVVAGTAMTVAAAWIVADVGFLLVRQLSNPGVAPVVQRLSWGAYLAACADAVLVRTWSEGGRLLGHWHRRRLPVNLFRRFNWFGTMWPGAVAVERRRTAETWLVRTAVAAAALWFLKQRSA